jgi:hypothetical protein
VLLLFCIDDIVEFGAFREDNKPGLKAKDVTGPDGAACVGAAGAAMVAGSGDMNPQMAAQFYAAAAGYTGGGAAMGMNPQMAAAGYGGYAGYNPYAAYGYGGYGYGGATGGYDYSQVCTHSYDNNGMAVG